MCTINGYKIEKTKNRQCFQNKGFKPDASNSTITAYKLQISFLSSLVSFLYLETVFSNDLVFLNVHL